jgi:hypothetical protein
MYVHQRVTNVTTVTGIFAPKLRERIFRRRSGTSFRSALGEVMGSLFTYGHKAFGREPCRTQPDGYVFRRPKMKHCRGESHPGSADEIMIK